MKLSVIMVTMNRSERALRSLAAVTSQTMKPSGVIVIDSSVDNKLGKSANTLLKKAGIKLVYVHEKLNMTQARNAGIKRSTGDIILFIDDDVVLHEDYVEKLMKFYNDYPDAGGACGHLCDGNKFLIDRFRKFPKIPSMDEPFTIIGLHGSNMSFRKAVFGDYMFEEKLRGYYADDDEFSARVSRKYKLYLVPYMTCIHEHTSTGGARLDEYTNFNTMIFNRNFVFRQKKPSLFNIFHYLFSDAIMMMRIALFFKGSRGRAFKGMLRGYKRILRSSLRGDFEQELQRL
ncbi:MAG: glycosyltransferase family 2 protein [Candidatus Aenigmatarchaeota archaeon]